MRRRADAGPELSRFVRPQPETGSPRALSSELGLRAATFEVSDLQGSVNRLAANGRALVGGIADSEDTRSPAQVHEPEGIIVGLAQRIC